MYMKDTTELCLAGQRNLSIVYGTVRNVKLSNSQPNSIIQLFSCHTFPVFICYMAHHEASALYLTFWDTHVFAFHLPVCL